MARPSRVRRVCKAPTISTLVLEEREQNTKEHTHDIILTVDEYETIRLIDLEGVSQSECAKRMDIGRTTAQAIYNSARGKLAHCLIYGDRILIDGGNYKECDGSAGCPNCGKA